jgi:hypothetical protein
MAITEKRFPQHREGAMIARLLFHPGGFWELMFWLLVLELARLIGG